MIDEHFETERERGILLESKKICKPKNVIVWNEIYVMLFV
jgi:hypothetical protein